MLSSLVDAFVAGLLHKDDDEPQADDNIPEDPEQPEQPEEQQPEEQPAEQPAELQEAARVAGA